MRKALRGESSGQGTAARVTCPGQRAQHGRARARNDLASVRPSAASPGSFAQPPADTA